MNPSRIPYKGDNRIVRLAKDMPGVVSRKSSKKKKKLLTVRQPLDDEYYLYVYLGDRLYESSRSDIIPVDIPQIGFVIAIPLGYKPDNSFSYEQDETSVKLQGQARSPTGMTEVENLQVFGDALLENSPTRLRWQEKMNSPSLQLASQYYTYCVWGNTMFPCWYNMDRPLVYDWVQLRRIPCVVGNDWIKWTYAVTLGFKPKGTCELSFFRNDAEDRYEYQISWEYSESEGKVSLGMVCERSCNSAITATHANRAPYKWEREECRSNVEHYTFETTVTLPDSIMDAIRSHSVPPARYAAFNTQRIAEYSFHDYWYYGTHYHVDGGNSATRFKGHIYPGCAPQWEYLDVREKPLIDTKGLMVKSRYVERYERGSEHCSLWDFQRSTPGRNRGGVSVYSELQENAIATNRYINTNLPMFFADIANALEDWNNLADQFQGNLEHLGKLRKAAKLSAGDLRDIAKDASNTYLPLKYGWHLTMDEAVMIGEHLERIWEDVRLASEPRYLGPSRVVEKPTSTAEYFYSLSEPEQTFVWKGTILPEPNSFSGLFAFLDERSLWLTTSDAWDWIPYSFVVNWFFDLPKNGVKAADFQAWKANYFPLEISRSYKLTGKIGSMDLFAGNRAIFVADEPSFKFYHRWWNREFDPPNLQSTDSSWQDRSTGHWCELGALIIQRL